MSDLGSVSIGWYLKQEGGRYGLGSYLGIEPLSMMTARVRPEPPRCPGAPRGVRMNAGEPATGALERMTHREKMQFSIFHFATFVIHHFFERRQSARTAPVF